MTPDERTAALQRTILWAGGIMLAYTFMGGLWAVMITDFMQFLIQSTAVLILFPLAFAYAFSKVGGLSGFIENAPARFFTLTHSEYDWVYLASTIVLYCLSYSVNWSLVQRFYCVPDEKESRKVGYLVTALNVVTPPLMFMPAMAAYYFLPGLADANRVFPEMCAILLPMGLVGLMVAAMFSATMSMLSTDYNVCASVLTNDVYRRLIRPGASQTELVTVGRLMTLLVGVISMGVAFWMTHSTTSGGDGLFRSMVKLFSVAVPPVAIPMLWGLMSWKISSAGAMAGFIAGVTTGLTMLFRVPAAFFAWIPQKGEGVLFAGTVLQATWKLENLVFWTSGVVTFATIVIVSRLLRPSVGERERAAAFLERLNQPILPPDEGDSGSASAAVSPFRIVGVCTILVGLMLAAVSPWVSGEGTVSAVEHVARELNLGLGIFIAIVGGLMVWRSRRSIRTRQAGLSERNP